MLKALALLVPCAGLVVWLIWGGQDVGRFAGNWVLDDAMTTTGLPDPAFLSQLPVEFEVSSEGLVEPRHDLLRRICGVNDSSLLLARGSAPARLGNGAVLQVPFVVMQESNGFDLRDDNGGRVQIVAYYQRRP